MGDRVVFWDFDGTLVSRKGMWTGALMEALARVHPAHAIAAADLRAQLSSGFPWHDADRAHPELASPDAWWAALRLTLCSAYRRAGVADGLAAAAAELARECYLDTTQWTVDPAAAGALDLLAASGWRHVLLSNHVPELPELVERLGLGRHFAQVLTSAHIGYEKPHPTAYAIALERAGRPATAWMVGDNPVADVAGARAAGLSALLVGAKGGLSLDAAARRILAAHPDRR